MSCATVTMGTRHTAKITIATPVFGALASYVVRRWGPQFSQGMTPLRGAAFQGVATIAVFALAIPGNTLVRPGLRQFGATPRTANAIMRVIIGCGSGIVAYYALKSFSKLPITPESALANAVVSAVIVKIIQLGLEHFFPPKQGQQPTQL